jgi:hypothetical protein
MSSLGNNQPKNGIQEADGSIPFSSTKLPIFIHRLGKGLAKLATHLPPCQPGPVTTPPRSSLPSSLPSPIEPSGHLSLCVGGRCGHQVLPWVFPVACASWTHDSIIHAECRVVSSMQILRGYETFSLMVS